MANVKDKKGIGITGGFKYLAEKPLDVRFVVADEIELQSIKDNYAAYPGLFVWVETPNEGKNNLRLYDGESFIEFNTQGSTSNTGMTLKGRAEKVEILSMFTNRYHLYGVDDDDQEFLLMGEQGDVWIAPDEDENQALFKYKETTQASDTEGNLITFTVWEKIFILMPRQSVKADHIKNKTITLNKLGEDVLKFIDPPKEEVEAEETEEGVWIEVNTSPFGSLYYENNIYRVSAGYNIFGKLDANIAWHVVSLSGAFSYNTYNEKPNPEGNLAWTGENSEIDILDKVRSILENNFTTKKPEYFYIEFFINKFERYEGTLNNLYELNVIIKSNNTLNNEGYEGSFKKYLYVYGIAERGFDWEMSIKFSQRMIIDRDIKIQRLAKEDDPSVAETVSNMRDIQSNGPKPANDPYEQLSIDNSDNLYPGVHTVFRKNMYGNHEEIQLVTKQSDNNIIQYYEEKDEKSSYYMYRKYEIAGTEYKLVQDWTKVDLPSNFDITKNFTWELTDKPYNYIVEKSLEDSSLPEYFYVNYKYYVHKEPDGKDEEYYEDRFIIHILDMSDNKYYLAVDEKGFGYTAKDTDIIVKDCSATEIHTNVVYREGTNISSYGSINAFHNIVIPKTSWEVGKTYTLTVDKITGIPATLAYPYHIRTKLVCIDVAGNTLYEDNFGMQLYDIKFKFTIPENTSQVILYIQLTGDTWESGICEAYNILMYEGTELKEETYLSKDIKILPEQLPDNLGTSNKSYKLNLLGTEWLRFAKLTDKDIFGSGIITINCYGELDNSQTPFTSSMFGVNVGYDSTGKLVAKIEPISQSKAEADAESDGSGSGAIGSGGDNAFYGLSNVRFSEDEDSIYLEGLFSAPTVQDAYNNIIVEIIIDNNSNIEYLNELEVSYTSNGDNVLVDGGLLYEKEYIAKITFNNSELGEYINKLKETPLQDDILLTVNRGEHLPTLNIYASYQDQDDEEWIVMPVFGQGDYLFHYISNAEGTMTHLNVIEINTQSTRTGIIDIDLFKEIDIKFEAFLPVKVDSITFKSQNDLGHLMLQVYTSPVDIYILDVEYYVNDELVTMPFEVKRFDKLSIKYTIPDSIIPYASNGMYKMELFTEFWTEDLVISVQDKINLKGQLAMLNKHTLEWHDPDFPGTIELVEAVPKTEATALTSISGFEKLLENYAKKSDINYNVNTYELVINVNGNVDDHSGYIKYGMVGDELGLWSNTTDGSLGLGNSTNDGVYLYAYDLSEQGDNKYISFGSWLKSSDNYSNEIPILFDLCEEQPRIILKGGTNILNTAIYTYHYYIGERVDDIYGWIGHSYNNDEIGLYSSSRHPISLYDTDVDVDYLYCYHNDNDMLYITFGGSLTPESYENPITFDINNYNPTIYVKDRNIIEELDNINARLDNLPVFEKEVSTNAYEQIVPNNALDYALVEEIGGMSYESENLIALKDVEETTSDGITYSTKDGVIKVKGTLTISTTKYINIQLKGNLTLNGTYSHNWFMIKNSANNIVRYEGSGTTFFSTSTIEQSTKTETFENSTMTKITIPIFVETNVDIEIKPMLVKGSVVPTTFEQGYSGFYNAKVTSVNFEQKNLIQLQERTQSLTAYTAEIDKDGWITLNKPANSGDMWFTLANQGELKIPKGKTYNARAVFYGEKVQNIGSIVFLYENVTDTPNTRFRTLGFSSGNSYIGASNYATENIGKIYIYGGSNLEIVNAKFKVELVENDFMNDSIVIPSEVQTLEGYGLGINVGADNYNYIKYNEEENQYYFHKNVASYTFTGNETIYENITSSAGKVYQYAGISSKIYIETDGTKAGVIKTELLDTISTDNVWSNNNGVSTKNGSVMWYIDSIQTLEDFKTYITGKTIIYKLATPEEIDISSYMNDEYLQVQENGSVKFINEKQKAVPNKITYAIKVV